MLTTLEPGHIGVSPDLLGRSCWAVRVGEELVGCRRRLADAGDGDPWADDVALNRLELVMTGALANDGELSLTA